MSKLRELLMDDVFKGDQMPKTKTHADLELHRREDGSFDFRAASQHMYVISIDDGVPYLRALVDRARAEERKMIVEFIEEQGTTPRKSIKEIRNLGL